MDGTLWDSAEQVAESWSIVLKEQGIDRDAITTEDMYSVMGKTMDQIAEVLFPDMEEQARSELLERCCIFENEYLKRTGGQLYPKLRETLEKLKKRYHLYIVSNCQSGYIEAFLDYYKLWDLIEDIECYGNNGRPKGENIALVVERNHLDRAVYVGDIQGDYDSSRQAGIDFIHAAYGFGTISDEVPRIEAFDKLPGVAELVLDK